VRGNRRHLETRFVVQVYFSASDTERVARLEAGGQAIANDFSSIPATLWFMVVTMMTVGYGDLVPTTTLGRFVTCIAMALAMLVLALPISVVGTNFTQARIPSGVMTLCFLIATMTTVGYDGLVPAALGRLVTFAVSKIKGSGPLSMYDAVW
jgi:Ion channel